MAYEHDADDYPEDYAPDQTTLHEPYDDEAEREAHEEDLAAQNAVEDAKYDFPPQEEPPEGYYDEPTHHELAEDLLMRSDGESDPAWAQVWATRAVARALLTVADQFRPVLPEPVDIRPFEPRAPLSAEAARWPSLASMLAPIGVGSVSPTDPAELGEWLRDCPDATIFQGAKGLGWQLNVVAVTSFLVAPYTYRAMTSTAGEEFRFDEGHIDLDRLVVAAPFTVLALGEVATQVGDNDG